MQTDENLQNKIKKLSEADAQQGLIALAKCNGVSDEGLKSLNENQKNVRIGDLSDRELEGVAAAGAGNKEQIRLLLRRTDMSNTCYCDRCLTTLRPDRIYCY